MVRRAEGWHVSRAMFARGRGEVNLPNQGPHSRSASERRHGSPSPDEVGPTKRGPGHTRPGLVDRAYENARAPQHSPRSSGVRFAASARSAPVRHRRRTLGASSFSSSGVRTSSPTPPCDTGLIVFPESRCRPCILDPPERPPFVGPEVVQKSGAVIRRSQSWTPAGRLRLHTNEASEN